MERGKGNIPFIHLVKLFIAAVWHNFFLLTGADGSLVMNATRLGPIHSFNVPVNGHCSLQAGIRLHCLWHSIEYQSTTIGQHPRGYPAKRALSFGGTSVKTAQVNAKLVCPVRTPSFPPGTHDCDAKRHNLIVGVSKCMISRQDARVKFKVSWNTRSTWWRDACRDR